MDLFTVILTAPSDTSKKHQQQKELYRGIDDIALSPSSRARHPLERARSSVGSSVCSVSPPCSEVLQVIEASRRLSSPAPEEYQQELLHTPAAAARTHLLALDSGE